MKPLGFKCVGVIDRHIYKSEDFALADLVLDSLMDYKIWENLYKYIYIIVFCL